jgi:DNA processing protein
MAVAKAATRQRRAAIHALMTEIAVQGLTLETFFRLSDREWALRFGLRAGEREALLGVASRIPSFCHVAQQLENAGIAVVPLTSPIYPKALLRQLGIAHVPTLLYAYGAVSLLSQPTVAIVGSRHPAQISLAFTESVVRHAMQQRKIVVSGLAKGIDRFALETCLRLDWPSLAVLPMGILKAGRSLEPFLAQVKAGRLTLVSACEPNTNFSAQEAMARNAIILGMAEEIFVPQSGLRGGTWEGVRHGLHTGRKVSVRAPSHGEETGNSALIALGATPLHFG